MPTTCTEKVDTSGAMGAPILDNGGGPKHETREVSHVSQLAQ